MAIPTIKQLNEPQEISVKARENGEPVDVRLRVSENKWATRNNPNLQRRPARKQFRSNLSDGEWMKVITVEDRWKINDEWWRGEKLEIERVYFDLVLENSQRLTVFHDLIRDSWSRQAE